MIAEQLEKLKVLLLTRDTEHAKVATASLASFGIREIVVMDDGLLALDKIKTGSFDFILCDQNIRNISGWLLIREIKLAELLPNIPVLLFGKSEPPAAEGYLQNYGIVPYLKFPFTAASLNFLIHSTISLTRTSGTIENKFSIAKESLINQRVDEAIDLYGQLKNLTENSARSVISLAQSHTLKGDLAKAETLLQSIARKPDDTPSRKLLQARISLQNGDLQTGIDLLRDLLVEIPNEFYFSRSARLLMDYNYYKDAEAICVKALEKEFLLFDIYYCLAKCYYAAGTMEKSLLTIADAEISFEKNAELYNLKGVCLKKLGRFSDAVFAYEEALGLSPADPKIYFNIAMCAIGMKDYLIAERHLATCVKIAPAFPKAADKLKEINERLKLLSLGGAIKSVS